MIVKLHSNGETDLFMMYQKTEGTTEDIASDYATTSRYAPSLLMLLKWFFSWMGKPQRLIFSLRVDVWTLTRNPRSTLNWSMDALELKTTQGHVARRSLWAHQLTCRTCGYDNCRDSGLRFWQVRESATTSSFVSQMCRFGDTLGIGEEPYHLFGFILITDWLFILLMPKLIGSTRNHQSSWWWLVSIRRCWM